MTSKMIAAVAALTLAAAPTAFAAPQPTQISYPTDAALDCAGLTAEIAKTEQTITEANAQIAGADGKAKGAGLANTVAVEGMLRTGVLGRTPGLGMLANQAGNLAKQRAEAAKAQAAETIRVSETRRAMLTGMAAGKGCGQAVALPPPQALPQSQPGGAVVPVIPAAATKHY